MSQTNRTRNAPPEPAIGADPRPSPADPPFLRMHGTLPLALGLLIAGAGVTLLAMAVGTARITQLRRLLADRVKDMI